LSLPSLVRARSREIQIPMSNGVIGVGKNMDIDMENVKDIAEPKLAHLGLGFKRSATAEKVMEIINREDFRAATTGSAPMTRPPP